MKGLNRDTKGNVGEFMVGGCPKLGRLLLVDLNKKCHTLGSTLVYPRTPLPHFYMSYTLNS